MASSASSSATEEESVDILFQNVPYSISIAVTSNDAPVTNSASDGTSRSAASAGGGEPVLALDLESLMTGEQWHGEFSASYLESITSKTGSFKRFHVLVKMLVSAMRHQTDSVALDLMTFMDLEVLKASKTGRPAPTPAAMAATGGKNNKRYLILTYVVDFDRVHYPLPLTPLETPTVGTLQRQVKRLRRELAAFRSCAGLSSASLGLASSGLSGASQAMLLSSVSGMQREVDLLRARVSELQVSEQSVQDALKDASARLRATQDAAAASDSALDKLRAASKVEVKRLRNEIVELRNKVEDAEAAAAAASEAALVHSGKRESDIVATLKETNDQLRSRVRDLTRQLALATSSRLSAAAPSARGSGAGVASARGSRPASANRSIGASTATSRTRGPSPVSQSRAHMGAASRRSASASSRGSSVGVPRDSRDTRGRAVERLYSSPLAQPVPRRPTSAASNRTPSSAGRASPVQHNSYASAPRVGAGSPASRGHSSAASSVSSGRGRSMRTDGASTQPLQAAPPRQSPYATGMKSISAAIEQKYKEATARPRAPSPAAPLALRASPRSAASKVSAPVSAPLAAASSAAPAFIGRRYTGLQPAPSVRAITPTSNSGSATLAASSPVSITRGPVTGFANSSTLLTRVATRSTLSDASAASRSADMSLPMRSSAAPPTVNPHASEIADIDSRLQQLQAFLQAAKSGGSVPSLHGPSAGPPRSNSSVVGSVTART